MDNHRIAILGLALLAVSCGTLKQKPIIEYRDSIRTEIRERIVHDTATVEIPVIKEVNVTRDTASHLENTYATSDAVVSGGYLHHSLKTKPQVIKVPVFVPVHDTLRVEKEAGIRTETQYVEKSLSWWQKFRLGAFWWLLGLALAGWLLLLGPKLLKRI